MELQATYFGTYPAALDAKGRTGLPTEFRECFALNEMPDMQNRIYMARRPLITDDGSGYWVCFGNRLLVQMNTALAYCVDERAAEIEGVLEAVSMVRFDSAGRFSMGMSLVNEWGWKDNVVLKGFGTVFEIYSPAHADLSSSPQARANRKLFRQLGQRMEGA